MARLLLFLLAILAAGIGYVMEYGWLYAVAGVLVLGAIALWVRERMKERRRKERKAARAEAADEPDELRSLGIMEIRPRPKEATGERDAEILTEEDADDAPEEGPRPVAPAPPTSEPEPDAEQVSEHASDENGEETTEREEAPRSEETAVEEEADVHEPLEEREPLAEEEEEAFEEGPTAEEELPAGEAVGESFVGEAEDTPAAPLGNWEALGALARAVRLATGARTACLLAQEELALDYRIDALDAAAEAPPLHEAGTTFSTQVPLLSASAARQAATHEAVGEGGVAPAVLGYYREPEAAPPEALALVPIPLADDPTTRFLVLDGGGALAEVRVVLLKRFASLFAELLASVAADAAASAPSDRDGHDRSPAGEGSLSENGKAVPHDRQEDPRPRVEIIAEEMQQAQAAERPLALALVYLNRAEAVAERGEEEVQAAERALRARLRQTAPDERVVRFGELTFGVFLLRGSVDAERWAVALQEELAQASDPLEGGASVGLALMRGPEQAPEALRENATNALREAYTTGTCTILE